MSAPSSPVVAALLAELAAVRDELLQVAQEQQAELAALRADNAERNGEIAEQARSGELGREWQTLQRRVDLGETSAAAVVRGEDDSAQAEVIRAGMRATADAAEDWEVIATTPEGTPTLGEPQPVSPALEARAEAARLRALIDRVQARSRPA